MSAYQAATMLLVAAVAAPAATTVKPVDRDGIAVTTGTGAAAVLRLSSNGVLTASQVDATPGQVRLRGLVCRDAQAVIFSADSHVTVSVVDGSLPLVRFRLALRAFDAARWQALFADGRAPFHFLCCSLPTAQVWHHRGWLNATPNADPFPLLGDEHVGSPEISCKWNRNWSYLCALGGHPIPMIGLWDPSARLYLGYDFQEARSGDQSERDIATAYCWKQGTAKSFITLAWPHGGLRYGELVYPRGDEVIDSRCHLVIDPDLPSWEDPNERFQARLFARYRDALPQVPAMNDLSWLPGTCRLRDFVGPIGLGLWGPGGETTFYPAGTVLIHGWTGHREMPIDTLARRGDEAGIERARGRLEELLTRFAKRVTVDGDACLFWEKPLSGAWHAAWGGPGATTLHNTDAWYPARVLVELYRLDRARGRAKPEYLSAIDGIFNWTRRFVWTRNEFADVPSSPFAIGGTLSVAFLLDYYHTFRDDPARRASAALAMRLAANLTWRYLPIWAMDSDRSDGALDSAFLIEPNSGRDWAALACANEVHWNLDTLTQVYVHCGDDRMRWYLRGILQRWPQLYRPLWEDSLQDTDRAAMTEGLGFYDGAGPGRGGRYNYGAADALPLNEPVGESRLRVVAGPGAAIGFCKGGPHSDLADYRTDGRGACTFRIQSRLPGEFDVSFSYPYVDVSKLPVHLTRDGSTSELKDGAGLRRPLQSPSSLYLSRLRAGDVIRLGDATALTAPPVVPVPPTGATWLAAASSFVPLPLGADTPLVQDWTDLDSFAGLVPGVNWAYGVPYRQPAAAASQVQSWPDLAAKAVFVAYAPVAAARPALLLDGGQRLELAADVAPAWRAWPPMFRRRVLLGSADLPPGRRLSGIDPSGNLVMAVTLYRGAAPALRATRAALAEAAVTELAEQAEHARLAAIRQRLAVVPNGRLAILPGADAGPAVSFLARVGLKTKCVRLSEAQLVDPAQFSAERFALAFYLGGEGYPKTVHQEGDGKEAVRRYLAGGGTLVLWASGPLPYCYGNGPRGQHGQADPLLPPLGLPLANAFEKPPGPLWLHREPGQTMLQGIPARLDWPTGDPRLRCVVRARLDRAHRYLPLVAVRDAAGRDHGDAAFVIELGSGPAKGGRVAYVWSTLLDTPHGVTIMDGLLAALLPQ